MKNKKVVNLDDYKSQKKLERQIEELDNMAQEEYERLSPTEQKGYHNFLKLLRAIDKKYKK
tara:strand:- start:289 stop:471 length:183 start_codon:yes stop_codon:yes gene_type:complete